MRIEAKVCKFLKLSNIKVNKGFIKDRIQSHADYPNLISITDTFDEIGFKYSAVVADKSNLGSVAFPILAHIAGVRGMSLEIILSPKDLLKKNLFEKWNGIALSMPSDQLPGSKEYLVGYNKEQRFNLSLLIILISALLFTVIGGAVSLPFDLFFFELLSLAGVVFSTVALMLRYDPNISIGKSFCGTSNGACSNLAKSKSIANSFGLNVSDIALAYFSSQVILLTFFYRLSLFHSFEQLFRLLVLLSVVVSIASIYYQKFVAKAWCRICLSIVTVCIIQFALIFYRGSLLHFDEQLVIGFAIFSAAFVVLVAVIEGINRTISKLYEGRAYRMQINAHKRNVNLFQLGLTRDQRINIDSWPDEIILGDPQSKFSITIVCNPFCNPCANAHNILDEIIQNNIFQISVVVRFAVDTSVESPGLTAAQLVFSAIRSAPDKTGEILQEWFGTMNIGKFLQYTSANKIDTTVLSQVDDLIRKHESWAREVNIEYTPTLFLNGYKINNRHTANDLKIMLPELIQLFETLDSSAGPVFNDAEESGSFQLAETPGH